MNASYLFGPQSLIDQIGIARCAIKIAHKNERRIFKSCPNFRSPGYADWRKQWNAAQRRYDIACGQLKTLLGTIGLGNFWAVGAVWNI